MPLNYMIHMLSALIFIVLLPLPFFVRRLVKDGRPAAGALQAWRRIVDIAHLFLVVSLATGLWMRPDFSSLWFWLVIAVFIVMGAALGMVAKSLRLLRDSAGQGRTLAEEQRKLVRFSSLLSVTILVMFMLMSMW
ncbi:hypothetical protein BSNK01_31570 [Bacillaceae bacterium]